jgi:hypothetical protein
MEKNKNLEFKELGCYDTRSILKNDNTKKSEFKYSSKQVTIESNIESKDKDMINDTNPNQFLINISSDLLTIVKYNQEYNTLSTDFAINKKLSEACLSEKDKNLEIKSNCRKVSVIGYHIYLNRLYLFLNDRRFYVYDFESTILYKVSLLPEELKIFPELEGTAFTFLEYKLFFVCGKNLETSKITNKTFSVDLAMYSLAEEKLKENNLVGRYYHGIVAVYQHIYIIGGFSEIVNEENLDSLGGVLGNSIIKNNKGVEVKTCESLLYARYDHTLYQWKEYEVSGPKPKDMICPEVFFFKNQYIIAFSFYKFSKVFIMDFQSNSSNIIEIKDFISKSISNSNKSIEKDNFSKCYFSANSFIFIDKERKNEKLNISYTLKIDSSAEKMFIYEANLNDLFE